MPQIFRDYCLYGTSATRPHNLVSYRRINHKDTIINFDSLFGGRGIPGFNNSLICHTNTINSIPLRRIRAPQPRGFPYFPAAPTSWRCFHHHKLGHSAGSSLELLLEHALLNRAESLASAVCLKTLPLCTQSDLTEP